MNIEQIKTTDISLMKRALRLAAKARGMTSPNPMVGAVIVKNGRIVAEDYHKKPGELHAEALAIQTAGRNARGSTLYVTLEPCCHTDKRTPPCTRAIIESGIKKVFVAMKDPNHKVSGKGIKELTSNGIEVVKGVLEDKARKLNEPYIKHITTGLPFVTLKVAMTLDGKIATPTGQSKWITGPDARKIVHRMRGASDAIMTAIGTVKCDNPELTARFRGARDPVRIILDPALETPLDYKVLRTPPETILVTRRQSSQDHLEKKRLILRERGVNIIEFEGERIDLKWLMKELGGRGMTSVMIEGGGGINSYAFQDRIVDKVVMFIAPKIIGGKDSIAAVGGRFFHDLQDAVQIRDIRVKKVGPDLMVEGYVCAPNSQARPRS